MSDDLLRRIQRLEDIEAIRDTWHDYMISMDARSWEAFVDVWTEDASVEMVGLDSGDGVWRGRESIVRDFYGATMNRGLVGGDPVPAPTDIDTGHRHDTKDVETGHHGTNLRVNVDGDEASTIAYFFEVVDGLALAGTYEHRMRRDPDRWRIAWLRITANYRCQLEIVVPRVRRMTHPGTGAVAAVSGRG